MTITLKTSKKTQEMMNDFFCDLKREKTPPYAVFQAVDGDTVVTLYESGKAVFQGKDADLSSDFWIETEKINSGIAIVTNSENKKKEKTIIENKENNKYLYCNSVGSDEVGTGDYFGPIIVTSSYVNKNDISYLKELGVCDSKKLTDEKIMEIAPLISKKIKYRSLILNNKDYNLFHKDYNLNKVKAIMHNKVLLQIINEENPQIDYIIVDEFAKENKYYEYLKDSTNIQKGITFLTKAEDKNLAVATSSIISRYIFLKEFKKIENSLNMHLPKGASTEVDLVGIEIVNKFGIDKLQDIAKLNFKNTERIIEKKNV